MIKTVLNSSLLKIVLILLAIVIMGNLFTSKFINKNNVDNFETSLSEESLSAERQKMDDFQVKLGQISTKISDLTTAVDNINNRLERDFFKVKPKKKSKQLSKNKKHKNDEEYENDEEDEDSDDENYEDDKPKSTVEKFAQQYVKGVSNNFVGDYMILE